MSNTFPFVAGQNFGPFVDNDIWNLVSFHKLMILGCIFSRNVFWVGDPSFLFLSIFDKLFRHYEFVLYCDMSSLMYFPNFHCYR